jgi:hypothetical protein
MISKIAPISLIWGALQTKQIKAKIGIMETAQKEQVLKKLVQQSKQLPATNSMEMLLIIMVKL